MVAEIWTWEEEKAFENALAIHHETCSDWWEKIVSAVPGKTSEEIKTHYEILVEDVQSIDSGLVPLPTYATPSSSSAAEGSGDGGGNVKKGGDFHGDSSHGGKGSRLDHERRKGIAWTEEEHRLFLLGLDKYGKGDWRSISRNFVISRTPTQVASHAQKYFIRLNSMNKDRRRSSIHDITNVSNGDLSASQGPITGQVNNISSPISSKAIKQPSHTAASAPGIAVYGSAVGRPLGGPLMPAIGTPVAGPPSMVYGIQPPPVPGLVVAAGAPVHLAPTMAYPMRNSSASHR
ncbi:transcription factor SRM1-like [Phalaenopsis equestris]|uniref:transcription factor SRM1-like n=1 Tax=Phalaenopsis equestris TaxID=78828 RepID=UPI0009E468C2|nr:transcription factor SRM1-like [Phalaenopsis equestris]